ncbi:NADH-quinone oxidoreductase subunit C [Truepera radiovictrix]|nr:NADH-quinone oxidoreductase subunit C [Truepera radiovictrix]WMT58293.1 NADH-quinone oxidoreductase subunit C [Truepera radiovictrix]
MDAVTLLQRTAESLRLRYGAKRNEFKGMVSVTVPKERLVDAVRTAKNAGFEMISDIFGIDYLTYPGHQGARFTVVYNLYSLTHNERLFIRVDLDDGEALPTITPLWRGANFMEREVYDMFGIPFEGHPDLRKLLTPEDLDGHPHRKDFPLGETPTLFNEGRFIDPAAFRAGMTGQASGLTGWRGGARKGVVSQSVAGTGLGGDGLKAEPERHGTTGETG